MLKRGMRAAAATVAAALLLASCALAAPEVSAVHAVLLDADSGRVLYEKNAEERALIASTTKIMTALLVCEQCNLADRVRIPKAAVGIEGSSIYLREGEILTVQDLLYGMMLHSGNDAAMALAIYCGGTEGDFVALMNDKAGLLGLSQTHFANPNGLDNDGNFSTALDLARLAAYAMKNSDFRCTVSCKTVTIGSRSLRNHNKLLFRYEGAIGVKTGYTKAAGRILVSAAERSGRQLIAVTINAPDDWNDHTALLDYGFSCYQTTHLVEKGQHLGSVSVVGGTAQTVGIAAAESFSFPMADTETCFVDFQVPEFLYAPVTAGQDAGTASIRVGETSVGTIPLYFETSVAQSGAKKSLFGRIFGGSD
ncbi:MAG: D-alanyl-D-alanine carboxypeptidase family protein [Oscillospiraceae bacterium]|nr:D-alanyl-D-alanine carboxypeptidase family protein [Oscillospiraceae bacterium]